MKTTRTLSRRSFFLTVAGTAAAAATVGLIAPTEAEAMQCTDSDSGRYADRAGNGRCRSRRSCSDSDSGRYGDPGGRGRRC